MERNIKGLVSAGHEMASELKAECGAVDMRSVAKLISDLATQLEVQLVRANALAEDHQRAIESIKQADAAVKLAHEKFSALAAENAGLKAAFDKPQAYLSWHAIPPTWEDPLPCGEYLDVHDEGGHKNSDGTDCWPVFAKPEIETPATDAFLAEVRAQGLEMHADNLDNAADDAERCGFDYAVKFLRSEASSVRLFADQLRKGGNQ
ncbi:eae-like domain protein [Escherichia coli]